MNKNMREGIEQIKYSLKNNIDDIKGEVKQSMTSSKSGAKKIKKGVEEEINK